MSDVEHVDLSHEDGGAGGSRDGAGSLAWPPVRVDLNGEVVRDELARPRTSPAGPPPPANGHLSPMTAMSLWLAGAGCPIFTIAAFQLQSTQGMELLVAGTSLAMGALARLLGAYLSVPAR